jgi:fatty acid desaturase
MRINSKTNQDSAKEPWWLALIAVLATGLVYAALPSSLSVGPHWLLWAVIAPVSVSALISYRVGHHTADKMMGYAASGILTIAMTWSLGQLVAAIPKHEIDPKNLLRSAVALWITNILVFALWYWRSICDRIKKKH